MGAVLTRQRVSTTTKPRGNWGTLGVPRSSWPCLCGPRPREFGGDPAATDSTRVLRLPGFANKKYPEDFYVQTRVESTETYHVRDFKLQIDSQDAPRHRPEEVAHRQSALRSTLSQSEHDWAYAKRALARGDDPEEVIRRIADYRGADKYAPESYARRTVTKAQAELEQRFDKTGAGGGQVSQTLDIGQDRNGTP